MEDYAGFIYEWTNKVNNMKYIGGHTGREDDRYIGGGKKFRDDLHKYGMINFKRKILEYVKDPTKLKDRENYYLELVDAKDNLAYYNMSNRSSGLRTRKIKVQKDRPMCPSCKQRLVAINLKKDEIIHYRSKCDVCIRKAANKPAPAPKWKLAGYKKKPTCDRCGFRAKFAAQLLVYHVDGNLHNTGLRNLKTVCQNCVVEIAKTDLPWVVGDLAPDV
jgi:hypothetical protein